MFTIGLILLATTSVGLADNKPDPVVQKCLDSSVLVVAKGGTGSGVAFRNKGRVFVWTAAHVVANNQKSITVIDPKTGQPFVETTYEDVELVVHEYENGRQVGKVSRTAKIIRYGYVYDLALLHVYKSDWPKVSTLLLADKDIPAPGTKLWHVGSMRGDAGANSLSEGVFSTAGRVKYGNLVFDQVSLTAHPGSSGGGVFLQKDGGCVGITTEFLKAGTFGSFLVVPARVVRDFARSAKCEWAVDDKVVVPKKDDTPVTQDSVDVPKDWPKVLPQKPEKTYQAWWFGLWQ